MASDGMEFSGDRAADRRARVLVFDNPFADEDLDQFCDDFELSLPPQVRDACLALASAPSRRGLRRAARRSVSHRSDILELFSPARVCSVGREKGLKLSIPSIV